jgi:hypothetical protein
MVCAFGLMVASAYLWLDPWLKVLPLLTHIKAHSPSSKPPALAASKMPSGLVHSVTAAYYED